MTWLARFGRAAAAGLALIAMSACGDSLPDARPPSPAGTLAQTPPDVLLFAVPNLASDVWSRAAVAQDTERGLGYWMAQGVTFDAAYARFESVELNRADANTLGNGGAQPDVRASNAANPTWLSRMAANQYRVQRGAWGAPQEEWAFFAADASTPGVRMVEFADEPVGEDRWAQIQNTLQEAQGFFAAEAERPRLFVFYALHGDPAADALTEAALRIPLVVAATEGIDAGERRPTVVTLADLGPTVLDLCGLWAPDQKRGDSQGASFARVLIKEPIAWRGFGLALAADGSAWVRSARWRLIRYADGRERLSQVDTDPLRMEDDRQVPGAVGQLRGLGLRLDQWLGTR